MASASASASASSASSAPEPKGVKSAPIVIPEAIRKPKPRKVVPKKPNKRGRKKKTEKTEMTREELLNYFVSLQNDPNFHLLPFPRFVQETNPELFAGESEANFKEKMKRIDFLDALENAETDEEREAIKKKREEELKNQVVPAYQRIPVEPAKSLKG